MPRRKKEDELPADQRGPPRGAANLRERTRMRVLSKAFGKLKLMLPWVPPDTKLSKLDTLRLATSYISHLQRVLDDNNSDDYTSSSNNDKFQNVALGCWPYGHHRLLGQSTLPPTTSSPPNHVQDDIKAEEEEQSGNFYHYSNHHQVGFTAYE